MDEKYAETETLPIPETVPQDKPVWSKPVFRDLTVEMTFNGFNTTPADTGFITS